MSVVEWSGQAESNRRLTHPMRGYYLYTMARRAYALRNSANYCVMGPCSIGAVHTRYDFSLTFPFLVFRIFRKALSIWQHCTEHTVESIESHRFLQDIKEPHDDGKVLAEDYVDRVPCFGEAHTARNPSLESSAFSASNR